MNPEELRVGNLVQLYRKTHHKIMTVFNVKSVFYEDNIGMYMAELNDGFIVNINTGVIPVPIRADFLNERFKKTTTVDPVYPKDVQIISWELRRNVYLLDWYDIENRKPTFILQVGRVGLDVPLINNIHELQNIYYDIFKTQLI